VPEFPPEEVTRRRQAWLAAEERLDKAPDNEHFEKAHRKAWFEYMATKSDGVERIPDEWVSKRGWNGYYLACAQPCGVDDAK